MHLKKLSAETTEEGGGKQNIYHARKKFKRAKQSADELLELVKNVEFDKQTLIEVEAYVQTISAQLDIEYLRYDNALNDLIAAKIIYKSIGESKDSLEAAIYNEKVDQIDDLLRLCSYNIQKHSETQKTLDDVEYEATSSTDIKERIQNSINTGRRENLEELESISYQGKSIPLKTEKLKNISRKLEAH